MQRIITLLLAAGLTLSAYSTAQAADIKIAGQYKFGFHFIDNGDYNKGEDDFEASQRFRTKIDIIASEQLRGIVYFEIGNTRWGKSSEGGALGSDGITVEVKRSYIDWTVPNTDLQVRMGLQGLALPGAAFGSPLFDEDVAGITLSYTFSDTFALTTAWARPYDGSVDNGEWSQSGNDEMDLFAISAPITFTGHTITPYGLYTHIGKDVATGINSATGEGTTSFIKLQGDLTDDIHAYWLGIAYSMTAFTPFTLDVDFLYGHANSDDFTQSGWMVDFKAAYALDFMTPALIGWYASGNDSNDEHDLGTIPSIGNAAFWRPTSFGYLGSCYEEHIYLGENAFGTWAIGVEFADISFIEDLSHVLRFVYMQGTNDKNSGTSLGMYAPANKVYLTKEDSAYEINFDSKYQIYQNFAFFLELGYICIDKEDGTQNESAGKATFNFIYNF